MTIPKLMTVLLFAAIHPSFPQTISQDLGLSSRVLRYSYRGSDAERKSQKLEEAAEKALEDLYSPATFDCDCDDIFNSKRSRGSGPIYDVSCVSLKSLCHNNICGNVKWKAIFDDSLKPMDEEVCIKFHDGTCEEMAGKELCFRFDYDGTKATTCAATVESTSGKTQHCTSCEICGITGGSSGGMQFLAPDCTNIDGMESKKFSCDTMKTIKDFNDIAFKCPPAKTKTTETKPETKKKEEKIVHGKKSSKSSKSHKSSKSKTKPKM